MKDKKFFAGIKRKARKAKLALAMAGALMLAGPVKARAEEPNPRPPITMKLGTGYDVKGKDARALLSLGSELPLPLRMKLSAAAGLAASLNNPGEAGLEEAKLNLNIPVAGPVWVDLFGHNARHLAVNQFSVGGDVGIAFPRGAAIVGFEHIFDGGQRPVYGILVLNAIKERLDISVSGGYVTNCDAGTAGGGIKLKLGEGMPALDIHTMTIFNKDALLFADVRAMLEFQL
jgi:hypothetical protein